MLLDDVCTFITTSTSHGLATATSSGGNLFKVPLPVAAPASLCAHVVEYGGMPGIRTMSNASPNAPVLEEQRFQIMVRTSDEGFELGRATMESVYRALDGVAGTRIDGTTSGALYSWIAALSPPVFLSFDENSRPRFYVNFEARKERG
jgi:hypothetical protein